jgi:hypothetical protein
MQVLCEVYGGRLKWPHVGESGYLVRASNKNPLGLKGPEDEMQTYMYEDRAQR